jgi:putative ABC transport system permease protein
VGRLTPDGPGVLYLAQSRVAASALGIDQPGTQAWLGGRWFTVVGIMQPVPLAPELDRTALIGFAQAARLATQPVLPTELYVRTYPQSTNAVGSWPARRQERG